VLFTPIPHASSGHGFSRAVPTCSPTGFSR